MRVDSSVRVYPLIQGKSLEDESNEEQTKLRGALLVTAICGIASLLFSQPAFLTGASISFGIGIGLIARNLLDQYDFCKTIDKIAAIVQRKLRWLIPVTGAAICALALIAPPLSLLLGSGFGCIAGATWRVRWIVQLVQ